jgi:hypothetical protein
VLLLHPHGSLPDLLRIPPLSLHPSIFSPSGASEEHGTIHPIVDSSFG